MFSLLSNTMRKLLVACCIIATIQDVFGGDEQIANEIFANSVQIAQLATLLKHSIENIESSDVINTENHVTQRLATLTLQALDQIVLSESKKVQKYIVLYDKCAKGQELMARECSDVYNAIFNQVCNIKKRCNECITQQNSMILQLEEWTEHCSKELVSFNAKRYESYVSDCNVHLGQLSEELQAILTSKVSAGQDNGYVSDDFIGDLRNVSTMYDDVRCSVRAISQDAIGKIRQWDKQAEDAFLQFSQNNKNALKDRLSMDINTHLSKLYNDYYEELCAKEAIFYQHSSEKIITLLSELDIWMSNDNFDFIKDISLYSYDDSIRMIPDTNVLVAERHRMQDLIANFTKESYFSNKELCAFNSDEFTSPYLVRIKKAYDEICPIVGQIKECCNQSTALLYLSIENMNSIIELACSQAKNVQSKAIADIATTAQADIKRALSCASYELGSEYCHVTEKLNCSAACLLSELQNAFLRSNLQNDTYNSQNVEQIKRAKDAFVDSASIIVGRDLPCVSSTILSFCNQITSDNQESAVIFSQMLETQESLLCKAQAVLCEKIFDIQNNIINDINMLNNRLNSSTERIINQIKRSEFAINQDIAAMMNSIRGIIGAFGNYYFYINRQTERNIELAIILLVIKILTL